MAAAPGPSEENTGGRVGAVSEVGRRGWDAAALVAIGGVALAYVWGLWQHAQLGYGVASADIYGQQYPLLLYVSRSLWNGWGLLWNGLQNCGQPVLPSTPPGTLYPLNLLFFGVGLVAGFPVIAALHLAIGGAGMYALCRELGVGSIAALCGAFAFQLSGSAVALATWLPTANLGAYVWLPVAMAVLERLLKAPAAVPALALGIVLALQLLAGCPQIALFTDQLIALRILWALCNREMVQPRRFIGFFGMSLALAVGLAAVQLYPSLEFVRQSVRALPLTLNEIRPSGETGWDATRNMLFPWIDVWMVTVVPVALAAAAVLLRGRTSIALFYLAVTALYLGLLLDTRLLSLYMTLPLGQTFRFPSRFLWVVNFAFCVLVGLGSEVVMGARGESRWAWLLCLGALGLGSWGFYLVTGQWSWPIVAVLFAAAACGGWAGWGAWLARAVLPLCVLYSAYQGGRAPFLRFEKDDSALTQYAPAFAALSDMMTPQDRMFQYSGKVSFSIGPKAASVAGLPSITDYEPLTSRRYAELFVTLVFNTELHDINQFNFATGRPPRNRPLMNLLATRFVMSGPDAPPAERWLKPPHRLRWEGDGVQIVENVDALPRAYYVPRLEVVEDPHALLGRLAAADHDPRQVALVERMPPDGFLGSAQPDAASPVVTVEDQGEEVRLRLTAARPGFVVLTDQYYPGWEATVNGAAAPVLLANYAFRALRVPAGSSIVEFRYRPRSVWIGALVTAISWAAVGVCGGIAVTRRWRSHAADRVRPLCGADRGWPA